MDKINLYLDDVRDCPDGFVLARNIDEAIDIVKNNKIGIMSLDHDLGNLDGKLLPSGYDFVKYICENGIECDAILIHSANPVGKENMYQTLRRAQQRGFISENIKLYKHGYIR